MVLKFIDFANVTGLITLIFIKELNAFTPNYYSLYSNSKSKPKKPQIIWRVAMLLKIFIFNYFPSNITFEALA